MAMLLHLLLLVILCLASNRVTSELVLEEGYTVSTILDGNKLRVNPSSVLPRPGTHDLIILDSSGNAFYTVSSPFSQDCEVRQLAGNGSRGFSDGDPASAMFSHPRSFAVDLKGNIYVADRSNHAIRKISKSGVTTIAGGYSKAPGKMDGPAQSASFSEDFELIFISERCSLLISDRGNRLVREMILKHEDCAHSQLKLGSTWVWALGLGIACLLSLAMWLAAHRFFARDVFSKTWKHCQIIPGTQVVIIFSDIRSAVASSTLWAFFLRLAGLIQSHVCLIFKIHKVENQKICREPVSLLDLDVSCHHQLSKEQILADQLKDMISFDGEPDTSTVLKEDLHKGDEEHENGDVSTYDGGILDGMIQAAIMDFTRRESPSERSLSGGWIVKRR